MVKKGDVLARLTNPQLQLDVTSREAQIASQLGAISAQRLSLQQTRTGEDTALGEARYALLKARRELQMRRSRTSVNRGVVNCEPWSVLKISGAP
uniref:hypothetical protein n=1 Tax=Acetobacter musti TaxID=864732 RepID=UPI001F556DAA|nr:hypothetical protein [Acetobacter musti]